MKFNFSTLSLTIALIFLNVKQITALDNFLRNSTRPKLFEMTDFKVPTVTVHLNETEYANFITYLHCRMDTNPTYLKRNEACYTAPWANLNKALERAYVKEYIKVDAIKGNPEDNAFVNSVINDKSHNITLSEFENIVTKYSNFTLEEILSQPYKLIELPSGKKKGKSFETNTASMTFELDSIITKFKKVKFSIGGSSSKALSKVGYNINIKDGDLYGTKKLRLRAESVDPSFLREKLAYDLYKIVGLTTISANYAKLYVNDTFMGIYVLREAIKADWIRDNFGEKDTKNLFACEESTEGLKCSHDDEDITDNSDFDEFNSKLMKTKTREELEEFFDVDGFIRWQAAKYLFGSLDHNKGKNTFLYRFTDPTAETKNKEKWIIIYYDFDMNFGNYRQSRPNKTFNEEMLKDYYPFYHVLEVLKLNDKSEELISIMDEIMRDVYNPNIIIPRIDELRNHIVDYKREDFIPDENGRLPGRLESFERFGEDSFTFEDFEKNIEFTTIKTNVLNNQNVTEHETVSRGLKDWIIQRFKFVCTTYNMDCSYADYMLNSPYISGQKVDTIVHDIKRGGCKGTGYPCCIFDTTKAVLHDDDGDWGIEGDYCLIVNNKNDDDDDDDKHKYDQYDQTDKDGNCPSLIEKGYRCCKNPNTKIEYISKNGDEWGVENNDWCGITNSQCTNFGDKYRCCKKCEIVSYEDGIWGLEVINGVEQKCAISNYCLQKL